MLIAIADFTEGNKDWGLGKGKGKGSKILDFKTT